MLYIRNDLLKSEKKGSGPDGRTEAGRKRTGEQRGGDYVARVQIGHHKDGTPQYKYFKTFEERDKFLQNRGRSDEGKKRLKDTLKDEQKDSKEKTKHTQGKVDSGKLFVNEKKKEDEKEEEETKKSLFVWSLV